MNPFVYDKPAPPTQLIDRAEELAYLRAAAESGQNIVLSSPRRYGKTSLLRKLVADLEGDIPCVFVDLSGVLTADDLLGRLQDGFRPLRGPIQRVGDWWRQRGGMKANVNVPGVGGGGIDASAARLPSNEIRRVLNWPAIKQRKTGAHVLVILDEFQDLIQLDGPIDGLIRSVIQHHEAVTYVFAGSHAGLLDALFATQERPLYGQAQPLKLGPLPRPELHGYLERRFIATGKDPSGLLEPLLDVSRGHPQRTVLLAHYAWRALAAGATAGAAWQKALQDAEDDLAPGFAREWDRLGQGERETVEAIARGEQAASFVVERLRRQGTVASSDPPLLVDPLFHRWLLASDRAPRRPSIAAVLDVLDLMKRNVTSWPPNLVANPSDLVERAAAARNLTVRGRSEQLLAEEAEHLERTVKSIIADVSEVLSISFADARDKVQQALEAP